jgi:hypothetical protein
MKRFFMYLLFLTSTTSIKAQPLSMYTDMQNQIMVWDNGAVRKIDYLQPINYKIGRIAIPYLDNSRNLKVYYRGGSKLITQSNTQEIYAGDCLVTYMNASSLSVFDRGTVTNLTRLCNSYYSSDSLVFFMDGRTQEFKAYYDGQVQVVEPFLAGDNAGVSGIQVGSNIAAYMNYANQFKIFYKGNTISQETYQVNSFKAARNIVAYVDANNQFKVFNDGQTIMLESFPPQEYQVGADMVAYVSVDGNFVIYHKGKQYKMGYYRPTFVVNDFVCFFQDNTGYSKVFQNGETTVLEPYLPEKYEVQYNSVAYFDRNNVLKLYTNGETHDVTSALSPNQNNWSLSYDVVMYQLNNNFFKFYYNGREY